MKSKYDGTCKECGESWTGKENEDGKGAGDEIFYQKEPKITCTDEACATKQGWKLSEQKPFFKSGTSNYQARPVKTIEQKMNEVDIAYNHAMNLLKEFTTKCGSLDSQQSAIFIESITRTTIQA